MKVYVVTNPDLGWNCLVGVFDYSSFTKEELESQFPMDEYIIRETEIYTDISDYY